jgi:hypothetical protein
VARRAHWVGLISSASPSQSIEMSTQTQDVAARLALAPEAVARTGVEVDLARGEGGGERLRVDVGDHQDAAVGGVLDDGGDEAGRAPGDVFLAELRGGHATDSSMRRTGRPAAAMAALTSAIEYMRRWKIEAARTASALPSRTAVTKSSGPAAPPDAMTGTRTRVRSAGQQLGVEAAAGAVAVHRGHEQLAGAEFDRPDRPFDGVEIRGPTAAVGDDFPALLGSPSATGSRRASTAQTTAWLPKRSAQAVSSSGRGDGRGVERDLVRAGPQDVAHLVDAAHAAADGERHERALAVRRTTSSMVPRRSCAAVMSRKTISSAPSWA